MATQRISSGSALEDQIGYSRAVVADEWVFVSGCTGYDYKTGELRSGVAAQADQALANIAAALAQVSEDDLYGTPSMADIVRVHYILPDRAQVAAVCPVLQKWLGGPTGARPAATLLVAGLLQEAMLIEIEATARRPRKGHSAQETATAAERTLVSVD